MKKPWSITTTLRNPKRLRDFLIIFQQLENLEWTFENQKKYQILLIQNRKYGFGERQFYDGLSAHQINLIDDPAKEISFDEAAAIFDAKNYEDPAMRGRQSVNVLKKFGFVAVQDSKLKITDLGNLFLQDNFDFEEIFFRLFLKWQLPNLNSRDYMDDEVYNIKPFIGVLHLINTVNKKEIARNNKAKGISKKEFSLFAPTLVHYKNIEQYADKIINLRTKLQGKQKKEQEEFFEIYKKEFAREFIGINDNKKIDNLLKNLKDYGDNAIRYFRLTRYIYIRGNGFYVDLEPRRLIEINSLLSHDNAKVKLFESKQQYLTYISDISEPKLPWETLAKRRKIIEKIVKEVQRYETFLQRKNVKIKPFQKMQLEELKDYTKELRAYRKQLQNEENHKKSQSIEEINSYVENLENIFTYNDRPILLEKLSALGLCALNDAVKIQPNYPVGDDNEPTFTAPANTPDIECFYKSFNAICEVTMLKGRDQWYNEGQPVMRHLRNFENKYGEKPSYCLFIAPTLHRDTVNTFWMAVKYEYEGQKQKIIPISIKQFILLLKILLKMKAEKKFLTHAEIMQLYDQILLMSKLATNSNEWVEKIPSAIAAWEKTLLLKRKI